jgi:hypothetical protein
VFHREDQELVVNFPDNFDDLTGLSNCGLCESLVDVHGVVLEVVELVDEEARDVLGVYPRKGEATI